MDKDSKYGDDVCSYTDDKQKYVKPCGKGKFCDGSSIISTLDYNRGKYEEESLIEICQNLPNVTAFYTYNGACTNDLECGDNYECIGNVCSYKCPNTNMFYYSNNICKDNSLKGHDGICYEEKRVKNDPNIVYNYSSPVPNKICGKLTLSDDEDDNKKGIYYISKMEYVYNGEVEDGEYVTKKELCKSGFALSFYKGGKKEDPKDDSALGYNSKYLMCVTPISIISVENSAGSPTKCTINYKINEDGEILRYNIEQLDSIPTLITDYCKSPDRLYIKLKYEKYREFYTKITEKERETCGDLDYANKYTCENNELIKSWYFYKYPKYYAMYNDRKKIGKVVDYYIQKSYPCYSLSQFLTIKFLYLLFLLLF